MITLKCFFTNKDYIILTGDDTITTKNGSVKIIDFFDQDSINKSYLIDEIITKDKTLNLEDIINKLSQTSNLNDAIFALNQDDIYAGKGNDILKANSIRVSCYLKALLIN